LSSNKIEKTLRNILSLADIEINGSNPWDIQVHNQNFYKRVLSEVELGLGESYMDGWWDYENICSIIVIETLDLI